MRFLGLLELFRDRQVEFTQEAPLAELTVTWAGADEPDAAAAVESAAAAEWDR